MQDKRTRTAVSRRVGAVVTTTMVMAGLVGLAATTASATADIGIEGPSYAGAYLDPSGSKPQSKLWHHDGSWWGVLFQPASATFRIHRLERATGAWVATPAVIDARVNSRADVLWDGRKLYVASHRYSVTSESGYPARLYRLSYDTAARQFVHDAGFPSQINNQKTESLVIDKDGTGRLWATWTQSNRIYVSHTLVDESAWSPPFILPGIGTTVASDDISSVVAFGGDRIGILWGNQQTGAFHFAVHRDVDPPATWTTETAMSGAGIADDHLSLRADATGRLHAVVKTSLHGDLDPLVLLLTRDPSTGRWSSTTVASNVDSHTRPIVQLDESARQVHVLMTGPQPPSTTGQKGGDIYLKSASMDAPAFAAGLGTPLIRDSGNATMNNVTSTKQPVSAATGLVALASTEGTDRYWHADLPLGASTTTTTAPTSTTASTPTTTAVTTSTTTSSTTTAAPTTTVPTTTTTAPATTTTTTAATTTTTTATTTTAQTTTTTAAQTTTTTTPTDSRTTVVPVTKDAYTRSAAPTTRYGASTFVRVQAASATDIYHAHLAFAVPTGLGTITSAKLRLHVTSGSIDGGTVHLADPAWDEMAITWSNAPALGAAVANADRVADGTWVEIDVTPSIVPGAAVGFALRNSTADGAYYSSREGANPPQLVITSV